MKTHHTKKTKEYLPKKTRKTKFFLLFVLLLITLFLISFAATTYILMHSYSLTFAGESLAALQQEIGQLKTEVSRKNNEIEELKIQLANIKGESSFVNQMLNSMKNSDR